MLTRRSLLAVPAALGLPREDSLVLDAVSSGHVILRRPRQGDGLILPADRARITGRFTLAGREITSVAFAADPDTETAIDLLALAVLAADAPPRLVALELLAYADAEGIRLSSTMAATSDATRVAFSRSGSFARGATLVTSSVWRDFLAWSGDGLPLQDMPIHPPPEHSWAALLAVRRSRVRVVLAGDVAEVTPSLLRDTYLLRPLRL